MWCQAWDGAPDMQGLEVRLRLSVRQHLHHVLHKPSDETVQYPPFPLLALPMSPLPYLTPYPLQQNLRNLHNTLFLPFFLSPPLVLSPSIFSFLSPLFPLFSLLSCRLSLLSSLVSPLSSLDSFFSHPSLLPLPPSLSLFSSPANLPGTARL